MKKRLSWLLVPTAVFGLGACKKTEQVQTPQSPAAVVDAVPSEAPKVEPAPAPAAKPPGIGVEERAAKLGFVKHLPQDTEVVLAFYNGSKTADRFMDTKLWEFVQAEIGGIMGMGGPPNGDAEEPEAEEPEVEQVDSGDDAEPADGPPLGEPEVGPAVLLGTEFTLAMGKSTGEQTGNLLNFYRRMNYFQTRNLAKSFVAMVKTGDTTAIEEALENQMGGQMMNDLMSDPQSGIAMLEKAQMPPIYMAFRTTEAQRAGAAQQLAATVENLNMMGPMVEPLKFEVAGCSFEGAKVVGEKIAASMTEERASMEEDLDAATVDKLIAAVKTKDLIAVSGTVGEYVVLFIGGSTDDLKLAVTPGESLVSGKALAFGDAYASKELAALVYGEKEAMDTIVKSAGGIADLTNGLRDGLSGAGGLGDTRDLEAMLQIVAEREAALRKLASIDTTGMVAYFEEGLKIESYGGTDTGMVDWKVPNKLAHLGNSEDVLMFGNVSVDAAYDEKGREYLEALMETGYAMAMKIAELPMENEEMAKFKEMAKMIDEKFRPDMVAMWDAMGEDFGGSLGNESAWVVDLKGSAPAIPGVSQAVVDKAKVPRISMICPVTDRAKLAGSWTKMNTTLTGALVKISELTGTEMPMQKPLSSEKNGNVTWFFPMPLFNDDFLPSVTVGDKWFVASSSKLQALDLISKADAGGEGRSGLWFSMNFQTLQKYADETLNLVDQSAESLMGHPLSAMEKKRMADAISVLGDLDKLTAHVRREDGVMRSSIYFKTR